MRRALIIWIWALLSACASSTDLPTSILKKEGSQTEPLRSQVIAPQACGDRECLETPPQHLVVRQDVPGVQDWDVEIFRAPPKKYAPLIYGAPKPLVCSREYPSAGKLKTRPNLQVMWEHYIYERPERVWSEIGGAVERNGCLPEDKGGWRNACTVRLSHMLNKAGHKIPYKKGKTVSGGNKDQYFYRLNDMQAHILEEYGEPEVKIELPGQMFDLPEVPGLFIIKYPGKDFTGHATIWNGAGTVDGADIIGYKIYFWELPCFVPPGRQKVD